MPTSCDRKYVIVSNSHNSWPSGALLFWGRHTDDEEDRSYGGYTTRWDQCEKYTREELTKWRTGHEKHYPFFEELDITCPFDFKKHSDVICTLEDLATIGYTVWSVVCRY